MLASSDTYWLGASPFKGENRHTEEKEKSTRRLGNGQTTTRHHRPTIKIHGRSKQ